VTANGEQGQPPKLPGDAYNCSAWRITIAKTAIKVIFEKFMLYCEPAKMRKVRYIDYKILVNFEEFLKIG